MAKMTKTNCKCCGGFFEVRQADLNRGWGLFCSKSCKAKKVQQTIEPRIMPPLRTVQPNKKGLIPQHNFTKKHRKAPSFRWGM